MTDIAFIANTGLVRSRGGMSNYSYGGTSISAMIRDIEFPVAMRTNIRNQAKKSLDHTRSFHEWQNRTGKAEEGIGIRTTAKPIEIRVSIGNKQGYVLFLEFGTSHARKYPWHDKYVKHFLENIKFKPTWRITPGVNIGDRPGLWNEEY